jgi:molecular chaperone GrpE
MNDATRDDMSEAANDELMNPSVERDSEVDDYTGEVPVVDPDVDLPGELSELDAVMQERDQFKDIALRLQADFENYRKRAAAQMAEDIDRATGRLAEALLPVLDAAEAAYVRHPDEVGPLLNAMLTELKKHGLETVDLEGQPFDPEVAEAVAHEPVDGGDVMVSEVMRSGYRWKGRTLRPAMVRTRD